MTTPNAPKPFSMIREFHLADWFTLANAASGTLAMFAAMAYLTSDNVRQLYIAGVWVIAALIFDILDGRVARWRQKSSALGLELDSLSDVISFGVAPAMIAYACGMQTLIDRIILAYFVACGVSRLARYNVTAAANSEGGDKVAFFEGTPIPSSVLIVCLLVFAASQGALGSQLWFGLVGSAGASFHPLVLIFALSGSLMISRIRIPKL